MIALLSVWASAQTVTVPLEVWEAHRPPAVVSVAPPSARLGAARYRGTADPATLTLDLQASVQVSLVGAGQKRVVLLSDDAILVDARVDGQPVPIATLDGHHVWTTDRVGEVTVVLDALIPVSGQRGSLEYDFGIPETPITELDLVLPRPDLRPQVQGAVRSDIGTVGQTTRVVAALETTGRVKLVGLRDLGTDGGQTAKLYAETSHLMAVDEHQISLFTVVRYSILYAGARRFEVFVPEGLMVRSADGEGAFSWEVVPAPGGSLFVGETDTPMRNRYELSLELVRPLPGAPTRFALPHVVGAEREHGWVGLEVPGRVRVSGIAPDGLVPVDVHQLPDELRRASVSPLLAAFRSHGPGAVSLDATPLPEVEVSTERIDRIEARSVVSSNGRVVTELTLTLRNRVRPGLSLSLPEGTEILRTLRDGEVVAPSRASNGDIVVPLRRSAPDAPFTVQVVLADTVDAAGWLGRTRLALPALDWPATEVSWDVSWPADSHWFALHGPVPTPVLAGYGHWLADDQARPVPPPTPPRQVAAASGPSDHYARYWSPAGEPLVVRAWHVAPSLWTAARLGWLGPVGVSVLGLGLALAATARLWSPRWVLRSTGPGTA